LLTAVVRVPVGTCVTVTCAPASGAPPASTTRPESPDAVSCAGAKGATHDNAKAKKTTYARPLDRTG
jgi:hypothetical protein